MLRSCVGPAPATRRHSATLSNPARHRCDVIYCSTACLSADRARRDCDETPHPHAFWCARAWFMMCCAWCSRAWGWAQLRASSAASQKNKRGCPSAAKRRRRRRRKSRIGSMAAAAPRRRKWAARCGLAIGPLSLRSRRTVRVFCARTRNSARRRSEASSAVSQSSKAGVEGHSFEQGISEAPRAYAVTITQGSPSARSKRFVRALHTPKRWPEVKRQRPRLRRARSHSPRRARRCANCAASSRTCSPRRKPTTRRRRPWRSGV